MPKFTNLDQFDLLKIYLDLYCLHLSWATIDNFKINRHGFEANFPSFEETQKITVHYNGTKWKEHGYASEYTRNESRLERHYNLMNIK